MVRYWKQIVRRWFKLPTAKHQRGDGNPLLCRRQKAREPPPLSEEPVGHLNSWENSFLQKHPNTYLIASPVFIGDWDLHRYMGTCFSNFPGLLDIDLFSVIDVNTMSGVFHFYALQSVIFISWELGVDSWHGSFDVGGDIAVGSEDELT